jgi:hypothetical protein
MGNKDEKEVKTSVTVQSDIPNPTIAEVLIQCPSQPLLKNISLLKLYRAVIPGVLLGKPHEALLLLTQIL